MAVRVFSSCLILLLASFFAVAETYFEVLDNEGQAGFGTLVQLDGAQITVNAQGELQTLPISSIVKIRNLAPNPYRETSSAAGQHRLPPPVRPRLANAATAQHRTNEQKLINFLAKIQQSGEQALHKSFPETVIALELTDGSRLTAVTFNIADGQATGRLLEPQSSGQANEISLPLDALSAIRFSVRSLPDVVNPPADWLRLATPSLEGDKLIVGNPGSFDVYTGILGEVNEETVFFTVDGTALPIPRHRIYGLVLHGAPLPATSQPPLATLTLWSGTQGMVSDMRLDGDELIWQTASGLTISMPLDAVHEIDFGEQGIASLFDFERIRSEFSLPLATELVQEHDGLLRTFFESRTRIPREIVLDGNAYERGVTLKGPAMLEYRLPRPFTSLRAVVGIEDQYRPWASSVFKILADSQVLGTWELRGDSASQRIEVHLPQNSRVITLVAEPLFQTGTPTILTIADPKVVE